MLIFQPVFPEETMLRLGARAHRSISGKISLYCGPMHGHGRDNSVDEWTSMEPTSCVIPSLFIPDGLSVKLDGLELIGIESSDHRDQENHFIRAQPPQKPTTVCRMH